MDEAKWLKKKEKALKENNKELLYESCKKLAEIYKEDGKYEESLSYFRRAQDVCERTLDIAVLNRWIGEVYCDMERFEDAIKYQKKHLELSKQESNDLEIQRALATLGRTHFIQALSHSNKKEKQKSLQTSYDYYLKSEETCDVLIGVSSQDLAMMKARLYLNIGLTLEALENTDVSMDYLHKAVVISKAHDLYTELTQSYTRLAEVYLKQQKHSEALSTIQKCISVSNNRLDSNIFCELLLLKCDAHVDMFDFASAKMDLIQAYKLKHLNRINREEVERKLKLTVVLVRNENKLLDLSIQQEEKDDVELNQTKKIIYEHMGDACAALGNYGKAIHFYHKMLDSCEAVIKLTYGTQLGIGLDDSLDTCCADLSGVVTPELCRDLVACYISLAQSYKDNKQCGHALSYFNRELRLHSRNYSEACKTLNEICDLYDLQEKPFGLIYETYGKALSLARQNSDVRLERNVLDSMRKLCKKYARTDELEQIKADLKSLEAKLPCESSSEDEVEDGGDIGDNINLEELSDLNSEDEKQADTSSRMNRKRTQRSHFLIKRNDKGETALHVAAARGNLTLLQSLLKQGHPVKVQDSAGWLPLHEAANHGHMDIVAALVDAGADPNDKGGTGISPLHDAAANGYLQVIECLLEKGASTAQRTDQGETALTLLEQCKARVERTQGYLDSTVEAHFEQVVRKLRVPDALLGEEPASTNQPAPELLPSQTRRPSSDRKRYDQHMATLRNTRDASLSPCNSSSSSSIRKRFDQHMASLRNKRDASLSPSNSCSGEESATKEYRKAISNLRHQTKFKDLGQFGHARVRQRQRQFLEEAEVGDDWLEEDVTGNKKRKYTHEDSAQARYDGDMNRERKRVKSVRDMNVSGDTPRKSISPSRSYDNLEPLRKGSTLGESQKKASNLMGEPQRKASTLLHESGTSQRKVSSTPSNSNESLEFRRTSNSNESLESRRKISTVTSCKNVASERQSESPPKRNPFEPTQNLFPEDANDVDTSPTWPHCPSENKTSTTMSSIKIKIESHLFLIPIVQDEATLKVGWLKQEASERYYRLEGMKPVLRIKTQDGALIDEQDPLASILNESLIHTEVVSWNKPPIVQRYRQLCSECHIQVHRHFDISLTNTESSVFTICPCAKSTPTVHTLFKTFLHWSELVELHLARSLLHDSDIQVLAQNMSGLGRLQKLNLSCNRIHASGLKSLSEQCANLSQLRDLDVSFNPLSSACLPHVNNMVALCPRLTVLNLSHTQLTLVDLNMNLYTIQELNISRNRLGAQQVQKLLSLLNAESLLSLNLSSTGDAPVAMSRSPCKSPNLYLPDIISMVPGNSNDKSVDITREVALFLEQSECFQLNRLGLSDIDMKDEEARLLHQVFVTRGKSMLNLDVSCNPRLSHSWIQSLKSVVIQ